MGESAGLQTARLSLRRPAPADIDAIYRIHSDPRACEHNPGDALTSLGEAEERYQHWYEHWRRHGFGYWTILRRAEPVSPRPLGFCGVKLMQLRGRTVLNLFYRLDPLAWGDGVATEAATAVVAWAKTHGPRHPIVARVRPGNAASLKVAAHAGLRRAEHLDTAGQDGLDWIFTSGWPDSTPGAGSGRS